MNDKKILVVDDEIDIIRVLEARFNYLGFQVFTASDGKTALQIARQESPDLILLDIMMPGMDGLEVKEQLNRSSITTDIPVIFLTAREQTASKLEGFQLGADDYITKPFNPEELMARVNTAINRKKYYEKMAMTDGLTGLYNIHYFQKEFSFLFQVAKRYSKTFSLALIDVDDFKAINDTHGHAAGDFVLKTLAALLEEILRKTDVCVRYGGDEFVVIFPEEGEKEAVAGMNRVSQRIQKKAFVFEDLGKGISFSISYGVVEFQKQFESEMQMFDLADAKLYEDKKHKRSCS